MSKKTENKAVSSITYAEGKNKSEIIEALKAQGCQSIMSHVGPPHRLRWVNKDYQEVKISDGDTIEKTDVGWNKVEAQKAQEPKTNE